MRPTIPCTACGTVLGVPKAGMPADGLPCNWCGYVNLPAPQPKPEPAAAAAPASPPPPGAPPSPPAPAAEPHRWADNLDDNGQPYALPPDPVKMRPCEACGKSVEASTVVCVHCGFDARTKAKAERVFQPIDRSWEAGWPYRIRFALFMACQAINVGTIALSVASGRSLPVSIVGMGFYLFLQAFLLGTYETIRIRRNKKGQTEITSNWRFCFIPMAPKKVEWRQHEGIAWGHYDNTSLIDWMIVIFLLPACILPAVLFWWLVIRADRYYAALARDRGYPDTYLYRGVNEQQARDIAQTATDATGLPLVTPL
jgi:hypothetical protein